MALNRNFSDKFRPGLIIEQDETLEYCDLVKFTFFDQGNKKHKLFLNMS
jgi:hypothetical protein